MSDMGMRYCQRCDQDHSCMEICPKAPGYKDLWKSWIAYDKKYPNAWWAPAITAYLVFIFALGFYMTIR